MKLLIVCCFIAGLLAGCNTMAGLGKDVKTAGEKIEDAAKKK
jgi:predicted small secreted protein